MSDPNFDPCNSGHPQTPPSHGESSPRLGGLRHDGELANPKGGVLDDLSNFSMLELFSMEIENQTAIFNDNLLAFENFLKYSKSQKITEAMSILESLMRAAHSIKGAARIVQIEVAVQLAHIMEDYFTAAMNQTITLKTEHIDHLFHGVDILQKIGKVKEVDLENWLIEYHPNIEVVIEEIGQLLSRRKNDKIASEIDTSTIYNLSLDDVFSGEGSAAKTEESVEIEELPILKSDRELSSIAHDFNQVVNSSISTIGTSDLFSKPLKSLEKDRFVRVSADNLNRLMGLAGEALVDATALEPFVDSLVTLKKSQLELSKLIEHLQLALMKCQLNQKGENYLKAIKNKERECREILSDRLTVLEQFAYRSVNLSDRLYREVINSHMRPFADGIQSFPRMVRDVAKQLNKSVKLEILGRSTPVDRDILKKLEVPLIHILRNAIAHGLESPQERVQQGKPPEGIIRLEASHRFGMLLITVSDDGQGIDLEKLRQTVIDKNMVAPEMGQQLTEGELLEFIFLPGFSTTNQVTEISGRGVGLNIAKTMVEEVGGNLQAFSKPDKGMIFHFQLPLTLSVIRTLLVEISGEPYAFPLTRIDQAIRISETDIHYVENRQYFSLNNQNIGLVRADQVLELSPSKFSSETFSVVIISDQLNCYGLVVDRFLSEKNLVIRPLDSRLGKVQDVSAAALLEDGSPVLILDVLDLVRSIDKILTTSYLSQATYEPEVDWRQLTKKILVIDDAITVREMERQLLIGYGYHVDVAIDGIDGWNAIVSGKYDLIISDIDMPRLNGIKLVNQVKQHPLLKTIPIIIVSYKEREEDRLQGLEAGADYYLTKSSFHDDTFIKAVVDLIGYP